MSDKLKQLLITKKLLLKRLQEEELQKGFKSSLLAGALTLAPGQITAQEPVEPPGAVKIEPWHQVGLHPELHHIAHLESSFGKFLAHKPNVRGSFYTAFGPVGLKVSTAHEEYLRHPELQKQFPDLHDSKKFEEEFRTNHTLYNTVATKHWERLKKLVGDSLKAAFAWRYGLGAAKNAPQEKIDQDKYVNKFKGLSQNQPPQESSHQVKPVTTENPSEKIQKSEDLRLEYAEDRESQEAPLEEIHDELLGEIDGMQIYSVNGDFIRNRIDIDFTNGGNGSRYSYVPLTEVWVEGTSPLDTMAIALHEIVEFHYMQDGLSYNDAHDKASAIEKRFRRQWEDDEPTWDVVKEYIPEGLVKSFADIAVGSLIEHPDTPPEQETFDYTHVLPPHLQQQGYSILVHVDKNPSTRTNLAAHLYHKTEKVGELLGEITHNKKRAVKYIHPLLARIAAPHRGKGLGQCLYEAVFGHAKNKMGVTHVKGTEHSTMASKVHEKLAQIHNLSYEPRPNISREWGYPNSNEWERQEPAPYDAKYKSYEYKLK